MLENIKELFIFTDGGSRGNPGPAAIGVYIQDCFGNSLFKVGKQIGISTNNVAEYQAVIEALNLVLANKENFRSLKNIYFHLDSILLVNQLTGKYKIKDKKLQALAIVVKNLEEKIPAKIFYKFIPREKNKIADFLVNSSFK